MTNGRQIHFVKGWIYKDTNDVVDNNKGQGLFKYVIQDLKFP